MHMRQTVEMHVEVKCYAVLYYYSISAKEHINSSPSN